MSYNSRLTRDNQLYEASKFGVQFALPPQSSSPKMIYQSHMETQECQAKNKKLHKLNVLMLKTQGSSEQTNGIIIQGLIFVTNWTNHRGFKGVFTVL